MQTEALYAKNVEELYLIHQKEFNIAFLDIASWEPPSSKEYLENNFDLIPSSFKCFVSKENFEQEIEELNNLYYILDECDEKVELINTIKTIVSNFADVTDSPLMGISIEKVTGDLCRYFHCDMNHLRLVYPLLGPGTLWTNEANVRRENLGKGDNQAVIVDTKNIFQVPKKTLTLLKGQGHPTAHGKAVVHASPKISHRQEKRILLRIESLF